MQSDGNRFFGDVVLKSVNIAFNNEDSNLDWIYEKQIMSDFIMKILKIDVMQKNLNKL